MNQDSDPLRVLREWREFAEFCDAEDRPRYFETHTALKQLGLM